MAYHSEPMTTSIVLRANKRAKDSGKRKLVEQGATEQATPEERSAYFQFGSTVFQNLVCIPVIVAAVIGLAQWLVDPLAVPVIPAIFNMIASFTFEVYLTLDRKRGQSAAGEVVCYTRQDVKNNIYSAVVWGLAWTLLLYGFGLFNALVPKTGTHLFYGLMPHTGLFGT